MEKKNEAEDRKFLEERRNQTAKNVRDLTEASRLLAEARNKAFSALCDLDREEANKGERTKALNIAYEPLADVLAAGLSYAFLLEAEYKDLPEAEASAGER